MLNLVVHIVTTVPVRRQIALRESPRFVLPAKYHSSNQIDKNKIGGAHGTCGGEEERSTGFR